MLPGPEWIAVELQLRKRPTLVDAARRHLQHHTIFAVAKRVNIRAYEHAQQQNGGDLHSCAISL